MPPQFHIKFDTKFETMRCSFEDTQPVSLWQDKCYFQITLHQVPPFLSAECFPPMQRMRRMRGISHLREMQKCLRGNSIMQINPVNQPVLLHPAPPPQAAPDKHPTSRDRHPVRPTQRLIEIMESKIEQVRPSFVTFEFTTPMILLTCATMTTSTPFLRTKLFQIQKPFIYIRR